MAHVGDRGPDRSVRVVIIDDNTILRRVVAIACGVTPGLVLVGEAQDGQQGLALCEQLSPDLVVLDLALPDIDGLEVARRLRAAQPSTRMLVLTGRGDGKTVLDAMRAGVDGFVVKTTGIEEVAASMLAVARGARVFPPEQERLAVQELGRLARTARTGSRAGAPLTDRELSILKLLAAGLTLRQAGTRLGISPRTVESHVAKIYRKLEVKTRVQAMAKAASLGLIELDRSR